MNALKFYNVTSRDISLISQNLNMTTTDILFIVLILHDKERKHKNLYKLILNKLQGCAYPVALSYVLPTPYHSFIVQPLLPGLHQNCCTWNIQVITYFLPPKSPASMSPGAQPAPRDLSSSRLPIGGLLHQEYPG